MHTVLLSPWQLLLALLRIVGVESGAPVVRHRRTSLVTPPAPSFLNILFY